MKAIVEKALEMGTKYEHTLYRVAQAWILVLIAGSLQPARPGPIVAHGDFHRVAHWLAFAGAEFLLLATSKRRKTEIGRTIAFCVLSLLLETSQHLIYRSAMEWWDVRDDSLAILVAFSIYQAARRGLSSRIPANL